jgi:hypothetical protein
MVASEYEHSSSKNWGLSDGLPNKKKGNGDFIENASNNFD